MDAPIAVRQGMDVDKSERCDSRAHDARRLCRPEQELFERGHHVGHGFRWRCNVVHNVLIAHSLTDVCRRAPQSVRRNRVRFQELLPAALPMLQRKAARNLGRCGPRARRQSARCVWSDPARLPSRSSIGFRASSAKPRSAEAARTLLPARQMPRIYPGRQRHVPLASDARQGKNSACRAGCPAHAIGSTAPLRSLYRVRFKVSGEPGASKQIRMCHEILRPLISLKIDFSHQESIIFSVIENFPVFTNIDLRQEVPNQADPVRIAVRCDARQRPPMLGWRPHSGIERGASPASAEDQHSSFVNGPVGQC